MSRKNEFIDFINNNVNFNSATPEVKEYWNIFSKVEEKDKPLFTDNGLKVLKYMREHQTDMPVAKSKAIADGLLISSRGVSGAMRKLVNDNYVEKIGESPCVYALTEKGKTINIEG